jgi:hypothetical protein
MSLSYTQAIVKVGISSGVGSSDFAIGRLRVLADTIHQQQHQRLTIFNDSQLDRLLDDVIWRGICRKQT